jgi:hypothetical protein
MSEITEPGYTSEEVPQRRSGNSLVMVKTLLENPGALKRMRVMSPDEERYVRLPREYELPAYRQGMRYCTSNEKYLRPTRWCNPREPLVIALANELGAYELSDWEFAEAAYWFVKTKFVVEFLTFNSVSETLERGTGTCYHLNSVWVALSRAAGIKARYKTFNMMLPPSLAPDMVSERGRETAEMFNRGTPEVEGEICIDGKWEVGHVSMRPEYLARGYLPITRFGEDAIGLTFPLAPGAKIKRFEGLSWTLGIQAKVLMPLLKAVMERASLAVLRAMPRGREIIEEAGGLEAYDRKARRRMGLFSEEEITRRIMEASAHKSWSLKGDG